MNHFRQFACRVDRRFVIGPLLVVLSLGLVAAWHQASRAELQGPSAVDRQIVLMTKARMEGMHLSRHLLDDEISQRTLKMYLKSLDPMKVYFYQGDIDEFMAHRNQIDDMIKHGDISLSYTIFRRFLQRVDERTAMIDELLKQHYDFQADEVIMIDRDAVSYPKDQAEARERWRKRIKYELLSLKLEETLALKDTPPNPKEVNTTPPKEVSPQKTARQQLHKRYRNIKQMMHKTDMTHHQFFPGAEITVGVVSIPKCFLRLTHAGLLRRS